MGLLVSFHTDLAAGGTIVLVVTVWFGISLLIAPRHGVLSRVLRPVTQGVGGQGSGVSTPEGSGQ